MDSTLDDSFLENNNNKKQIIDPELLYLTSPNLDESSSSSLCEVVQVIKPVTYPKQIINVSFISCFLYWLKNCFFIIFIRISLGVWWDRFDWIRQNPAQGASVLL